MIELAKPSREEFRMAGEEIRRQMLQRFDELMAEDKNLLDEDGYPSDHALDLIEAWPWTDPKGWFEFINSIWHLKSWGWKEGPAIDEITGKQTYCYYISTAGWSGNESIIHAMEKNDTLWHFTWVQSRKGGHYIFEIKDEE